MSARRLGPVSGPSRRKSTSLEEGRRGGRTRRSLKCENSSRDRKKKKDGRMNQRGGGKAFRLWLFQTLGIPLCCSKRVSPCCPWGWGLCLKALPAPRQKGATGFRRAFPPLTPPLWMNDSFLPHLRSENPLPLPVPSLRPPSRPSGPSLLPTRPTPPTHPPTHTLQGGSRLHRHSPLTTHSNPS